MVGVLIVSHGPLAKALISSVQIILGNLPKVKGISIWPRERPSEVKDRIKKRMQEVQDGDGVIILTDLLGGTPTNLSLSSVENEKAEVITGVNLPMLLTIMSYRKGKSLEKICSFVRKAGRKSILLAKNIARCNESKIKAVKKRTGTSGEELSEPSIGRKGFPLRGESR
jgi:mannose PTS system EIIA component